MDAVHAWDQQDIYFYVPGGDDHFDYQGIFYQTSLRGRDGAGNRGRVRILRTLRVGWSERQAWRLPSGSPAGHELQDAGGGVSGGMATFAE
jgi:hypothetical protein